MSTEQRALVAISNTEAAAEEEEIIRDIHALTPPRPPPSPTWESTSSLHIHPTSNMASSENLNFTTMGREFNAMVLSSSTIGTNGSVNGDVLEDHTNPLAIVPDYNNPPASSFHRGGQNERSVERVKKEEVSCKINAWENAKVAKVNNRFKRQDAIISAWQTEEVHKANSWMKKVERKLEEKRVRALEKMQNDIAKAQRKADEKRATAEAKRGTKVAKILQVTNLMRAVGRPPVKHSFF